MKRLDLTQPLRTFTGEPMTIGEGTGQRPLTLKEALLVYLANADGLTHAERATAYEVGCLVGTGQGRVELEQHQYDVVKKLCDAGKILIGGQSVPAFNLAATEQAKRMVDAAEVVKEVE